MKTCSVIVIVFVFLAALYLPGTPAPTEVEGDSPIAPLCLAASHDRLVEQKGRDVCAPAIDEGGYARAVGLMPTECPETAPRLVIDADKLADRCLPGKAAPASTSDPAITE